MRRRETKMLPALDHSPWLENMPARTSSWVTHFRGLHAVVSSKSLLTVPCCKWGLLTALDVDGAELLHTPEASGWHTGVGKVGGLLVTARTAGGGQAMVTWQGGAPRRWIVLHWALHAVLLEQLLIYELMVLTGGKNSAITLWWHQQLWPNSSLFSMAPFARLVACASPLSV